MKNDFKNYAVNHLGIPSTTLDSYENSVSGITAMNTPAIVIEKPTNMQVVSVFDALIKDKIIYVTGTVNDQMANIISAQLLYLDTLNTNEPITFYINSGGGSVYSGNSIISSMYLSKTPVDTICFGMAASMASVILGKGNERSIVRFGRVMLHQSSGGANGGIIDSHIAFKEWNRLNDDLFELLGESTNKTSEQVKKDAERDLWLNPIEALEYGIVDKIYWSKDKVITLDNLHEVKK